MRFLAVSLTKNTTCFTWNPSGFLMNRVVPSSVSSESIGAPEMSIPYFNMFYSCFFVFCGLTKNISHCRSFDFSRKVRSEDSNVASDRRRSPSIPRKSDRVWVGECSSCRYISKEKSTNSCHMFIYLGDFCCTSPLTMFFWKRTQLGVRGPLEG